MKLILCILAIIIIGGELFIAELPYSIKETQDILIAQQKGISAFRDAWVQYETEIGGCVDYELLDSLFHVRFKANLTNNDPDEIDLKMNDALLYCKTIMAESFENFLIEYQKTYGGCIDMRYLDSLFYVRNPDILDFRKRNYLPIRYKQR